MKLFPFILLIRGLIRNLLKRSGLHGAILTELVTERGMEFSLINREHEYLHSLLRRIYSYIIHSREKEALLPTLTACT